MEEGVLELLMQAAEGFFAVDLEMLREAIDLPVLNNDQDIPRLQAAIERRWDAAGSPLPGYLIRGHGVYVWGPDMPTALLRLEALEFMLACEIEERRLKR